MASRTVVVPGRADAERAASVLAEAGVGRVVLFGSVARGEATPCSDIDLMAIYDDLDYRERWAKRRELERLAEQVSGFSVDVSVTDRAEWQVRTTEVCTSFEQRAAREGVVLVDRRPVGVDWNKEMVMPVSDYEEALCRLQKIGEALGGLWRDLRPDPVEQDPLDVRAFVLFYGRLRQGCGHAQMTVENAVKALIHLDADPDRPAQGHKIEKLCEELAEPHHSVVPALLDPLGEAAISEWHERAVYHRAGEEPDATPQLLAEISRIACRVASYTAGQFPAGGQPVAVVNAHVSNIGEYLDSYDLTTGQPLQHQGGPGLEL